MNEIARINDNGAAIANQQLPMTNGTVSLMEWAQELSAAHQLGTALCGTDFVPQSFRGKPEAAAAAILTGKALGLDPMNALSNIFVVQGRPAMYARTMAALVLNAGHTLRRLEATNERVVYEGKRKGDTEFTRVEWSIERAKQAGYTGNKKYQSDPIGMLTAKCQAEICRVIAPDVLTGIAYSTEEVELDDMGETGATAPADVEPKPKRTVKRKSAPAPDLPPVVQDAPQDDPDDDGPAADESTGEVTEPEPAAEPESTTAQQRKIAILLDNQGYKERDAKLELLSAWTERTITTSKDLTKAEASKFIDEVEQADRANTDPADTDADAAWMAGTPS